MKPKISSDDAWTLPKESPARKAARLRKLRTILKKGTGLKPGELRKAIRPGCLETYRAMEDPAPYGRRRSRHWLGSKVGETIHTSSGGEPNP